MSRRKVLEFGASVDIGGGVTVKATYYGRLFVTIAQETEEVSNKRTEEVTNIGETFSTATNAGMVYLTFVDKSLAKRHVIIKVRNDQKKSGDVGRRRRKQGRQRRAIE
jgi:hypothetical protein